MTKRTKAEIYPSQLEDFKNTALAVAEVISNHYGQRIISSFKRLDALSRAAGYKSHSDLVKSTEFRRQNDKGHPLLLLTSEEFRYAAAEEFSEITEFTTDFAVKDLLDDLHRLIFSSNKNEEKLVTSTIPVTINVEANEIKFKEVGFDFELHKENLRNRAGLKLIEEKPDFYCLGKSLKIYRDKLAEAISDNPGRSAAELCDHKVVEGGEFRAKCLICNLEWNARFDCP